MNLLHSLSLFSRTFRSLGHKNYRMYFFGQVISLLGNWIQNIAMGWLVFRLTDSALLLGVVGFAGQIPSILITPIAGVYADKLDRRKVLLLTQVISMLIALTLAYLILSDNILVSHIIIAAVLNGIAVAIDTPFRHAFIVNLIHDRKDLPNAIALNSTLYNSARFIGPPLGGFLIAVWGEGFCFLINGLSYLAVIGSLILMRLSAFINLEKKESVITELLSGFKYAYDTLHLRILLLMVIVMSLLGLPFQVFMPIFAKDILQGDSETLGILTGALGAGAFIGTLMLAAMATIRRIPEIIMLSALMFSFGLLAFTNSTVFSLSIVSLIITGFGFVVLFASTNTLLQTMVRENMRGRIVALYSMSFMGFTPIGSLILGSITEKIGLQNTLSITSILCIGMSIWYYTHLNQIKKALNNY